MRCVQGESKHSQGKIAEWQICIHGTQMFTEALSTTDKGWKKLQHPSMMDERINKMWSIHTIKYYSATKTNEILTYTMGWWKTMNIC